MTACDLSTLGHVRTDWTLEEARAIFQAPFADLMFHAQRVHRANFKANRVQVSTLLSVKTGACPEDCKYCPQSVRYDTGLDREELLQVDEVVAAARAAKAHGATRFCMGAAYRSPKAKQLEQIKLMVREVHALGLETCATLGMLRQGCEPVEQPDPVLLRFAHAEDAAAAHVDACVADGLQGLQPVVVGTGRDDLPVELRRRVEVVVVVVEAGVLELMRLLG